METICSYEPSVLTRTTSRHYNPEGSVVHCYRRGYSKSYKQYRNCVRFEDLTAVTMKNGVFWDVTPCGSCENRRFGGT
jgi:hypothetical protein